MGGRKQWFCLPIPCARLRRLHPLFSQTGVRRPLTRQPPPQPRRQGLKAYSNWPTYPQLYLNGELLGGCDIICEMGASGELQQVLNEKLGSPPPPAAAAAAAPSAAAAAAAPVAAAAGELTPEMRARLDALLKQQPVMLFMKGSPDAPRCVRHGLLALQAVHS